LRRHFRIRQDSRFPSATSSSHNLKFFQFQIG
jgi:hypothetical protein